MDKARATEIGKELLRLGNIMSDKGRTYRNVPTVANLDAYNAAADEYEAYEAEVGAEYDALQNA